MATDPAEDRCTDYAEAVIEGRMVAGNLVGLACERHLRDLRDGPARGLVWVPEAGRHAVEFFPRFLSHYKGRHAGTPFHLEDWEAFCVGSLWGWQHAETRFRRFRTSYLEMARKNGKTTLAAGVGLLLAFADNEPGAEVYSAATKRDQAKICHTAAKRMVRASPALRKRITTYRHSLVRNDNYSIFEALGREADTMDGLDVYGAIIDEVHKHRDGSVIEVLDTGTGARTQPLMFLITTAGSHKDTVCGQHHDYAESMLRGDIEDDTLFAFIACIDQAQDGSGDDWTDPAAWAKANPSLGVSQTVEDLQRKCDKARKQPVWRNAFLRLHCSVWTSQSGGWLPMDDYDKCKGAVGWSDLRELLAGEECYGGLDLSSRTDFSAWVLVFPPNAERRAELEADCWYVLPTCWIPQHRMDLRAHELKQPVEVWHKAGALQATEGRVIDYTAIKKQVLADAEFFDLQEGGYDPYMAEQIVIQLSEEGVEMVPIRQGMLSLSRPSKLMEAHIVGLIVRHGGHPVLRWMADRVVATTDDADNIKPSKRKSSDRIDLIAAWVNALARAASLDEDEDEMSVYATREMLVAGG